MPLDLFCWQVSVFGSLFNRLCSLMWNKQAVLATTSLASVGRFVPQE